MAMKAFVTGQRKELIHPDDTDGEPTVFVIQALPHSARSYMLDNSFVVNDKGESVFSAGSANTQNVMLSLVEIKNLIDPNTGVACEFATQVINVGAGGKHVCIERKALDKLTPATHNWLVGEIRAFNEASVDEVKKSEEQS